MEFDNRCESAIMTLKDTMTQVFDLLFLDAP
eukprot:CAMPEP_0206409568 /NCGR_PEP_ID=MMETSP0294-20121207/31969_1 /ASSEMBLY_ACC=CAM_ASM_000327 /TAXON_ID=39354 /ORGANISM="Heterosigma akashiwo, Strain CCMP2393" /LENGTH=30 /DNA_ID= /DNA_START= /DNA_END= /DNA_ORIENTATION=